MKSRQISGGILCDLSKARINICRKKHAVGFWCKTDVYLACCMTCRLSFPSGCSTLISYSVVYAFSGLVGQWDDNILDYSTTYRTTYDYCALFVFVRVLRFESQLPGFQDPVRTAKLWSGRTQITA